MTSTLDQILWLLKKSIRSAADQAVYYCENPQEALGDVKEWIKENKVTTAFIVGGILVIVCPPAIGFSASGPVYGSIAAGWQSSIGNVVAGSLFATIQSWAMTGVFTAIGTGLIAAGGVWKVLRDIDWGFFFRPGAGINILGGSLADVSRLLIRDSDGDGIDNHDNDGRTGSDHDDDD